MCKGLDGLIERGRREGKAEGKLEERSSMIITALQGGSTVEEIARIMRIPIEEVKTIAVQAENEA